MLAQLQVSDILSNVAHLFHKLSFGILMGDIIGHHQIVPFEARIKIIKKTNGL